MRFAFIGGFGHHYLGALASEPSIQLDRPIAFLRTAPDDPLPKRLSDTLGDLRIFDDFDRLLDEYRPDALSIGAIYARNGDYVARALQRDIPIGSDKPIAATWEQLDRIRKLVAEKPSRILLTEFDLRARAPFRAARDVVRDGRIGEPILATAQKSYRFGTRPDWYRRREEYGGTMLWIASHGIDLIRFATGKEIVGVTGLQGNLSRPDFATAEDHVTALLKLSNGGSGVAHADFLRPSRTAVHGDDRLRVAGSKGIVEVRAGHCTLLGEDGDELAIPQDASYKPVHLELLAALRGEKSDLYSTAESLATAEAILHARDAADRQEWVRM
jgi:predicted dehydrogenase